MSVKEINRIDIVEKLAKGEMKVRQAAESLELSPRQVKRIKKRYQEEGVRGLIHQGRGKPSNRRIPEAEVKKALEVIMSKYSDFGPTLALEKLMEDHLATFSRETLRRVMIKQGIWKAKKKKLLIVHQRRRRREREGELVQLDGSPCWWFENRGPYCTLLVFIDDATGKLKSLRFVKVETTQDYFMAVFDYLTQYGKPIAFYLDKHGVFRVNSQRQGLAGLSDSNGLTQFGRAMQELNISLIFANSPQAKGRVEKANGTLQDRLVKEMRLRGISTVKGGNRFLPEFTRNYNQKFAVEPANPEDAHRPLLRTENLRNILVNKETRTLSKNLEFQYQNQLYQVKTERPTYSMRSAPVQIRENWKGKIRVYYKDRELNYKTVEKQPFLKIAGVKEIYQEVEKAVKEKELYKPSENHPWKHWRPCVY